MNGLFKSLIMPVLAGLLCFSLCLPLQAQSPELTSAEQAWIAQHPVIRVHNELDWPPFNFYVNDKPAGFSIEFMNLVAARTGLQIEYVSGPTWEEFLSMIRSDELDVMLNMAKTPERAEYLNFTDEYSRSPAAVVTRDALLEVESLRDLRGKRVAMIRGFFAAEVIGKNYPEIQLVLEKDVLGALYAVSEGRADALIANYSVSLYLINEYKLRDFQFAHIVRDPELSSASVMGVRKDWPILRDIIQKGLDSLSVEEVTQLQQRWLGTSVESQAEDSVSRTVVWLLGASLGLFAILFALSRLSSRLSRVEEGGLRTGSAHFRMLILGSVSLFLALVGMLGWLALDHIKERILRDVENNLENALITSAQLLDNWSRQQASLLEQMVNSPPLVRQVELLEDIVGTSKSLARTTAISHIRTALAPYQSAHPGLGFMIIGREGFSIASHRDGEVGTRSLLAIQQPELLARVLEGESGLVLPVHSDVAPGDGEGDQETTSALYLGVPIANEGGVFAALAIQLDPTLEFSRLAQYSRIGESGMVYAFDNKGNMLSSSRFEDELRAIGLLADGQPSVMNVQVRDPGGDMTQGFTPRVPRGEQTLTRSVAGAIANSASPPAAVWVLENEYYAIDTEMKGYRDYRGVTVYGAWLWSTNLGLGLTSEIDVDEALATYTSIRNLSLAVFGVTFLLSLGGALFILAVGERSNRVLRTARDELEQRVVERTLDLSNANQEILKSRDIAESATRAKGDFLANMSHEIRTPMNAILGLTHLALKTKLDPKQSDYLHKVHDSAASLLTIINDILDYSKIEAGKLDMEAVDFSLDEALANVATLIGDKAQEKGLEFLYQVPSHLPRHLVGDPLRLSQILTNLSNNAIKFTESGEVVITVEQLEECDDKVLLKFTVRDTGIGLTKAQMDNLFQSFSQADTSTTRKYGGTGLGLSISKKLTELMQGEIWVESTYGEGSSFIFTARFAKVNVEDQLASLKLAEDLKDQSVLVVDDNETSREIFKEMLESFRLRVTLANSGPEAIEIISTADPGFGLVLMDWQMPGMDGFKVIEEMRSLDGLLQQPKFVMATAFGREEVFREAERVQLDGLVIKPVSPSIMFDAIMGAFGYESAASARHSAAQDYDAALLRPVQGARILLAEDNEINQQVARELLEGAGFYVDIANNGVEALTLVNKSTYDIVLMDVQMPEMDGHEATRRMREIPAFDDLPILAMTAGAMAEEKEKARAAGMNDHVTKPIDIRQLFDALVRWIKPGEREIPHREGSQDPSGTEVDMPHTLEGINVDLGLMRAGGNKRLYRDLLLQFREGKAGAMDEIHTALASEDAELAGQEAHSLAGVAGNLGANDLAAATRDLELALKKEGVQIATVLVESVEAHLEQVMHSLSDIERNEPEPVASGPIDWPQVLSKLEKLRSMVEGYEPTATHLVEELCQEIPDAAFTELLQAIRQAVSSCDFKAAMEPLGQVDALARKESE